MVFSPFQLGDRQEMIYLNTPTRSVSEVVDRLRPRSHFGWVCSDKSCRSPYRLAAADAEAYPALQIQSDRWLSVGRATPNPVRHGGLWSKVGGVKRLDCAERRLIEVERPRHLR